MTYRNVIYLKRSLMKIVIQIWNKISIFGSSGLIKNSREKPCLSRPLRVGFGKPEVSKSQTYPFVYLLSQVFSRVLGVPVTILHTIMLGLFSCFHCQKIFFSKSYAHTSIHTKKAINLKMKTNIILKTFQNKFRINLVSFKIFRSSLFRKKKMVKHYSDWALTTITWQFQSCLLEL